MAKKNKSKILPPSLKTTPLQEALANADYCKRQSVELQQRIDRLEDLCKDRDLLRNEVSRLRPHQRDLSRLIAVMQASGQKFPEMETLRDGSMAKVANVGPDTARVSR